MAIAPNRVTRYEDVPGKDGAAGVTFTLNGTPITAHDDETILQAADRHGVEIPRLCYKEGYRPDGNCRVCMVEINGERVLAPSCCRKPAEGMKVSSTSARATKSARMVTELLLTDMPGHSTKQYKLDSELDFWAGKLGVTQAAVSPAHAMAARRVASGDVGPPRRLHPVRPLRARVPRGAGQRRHRLRVARRAREDRVRLRRPDGREHVRVVRRVLQACPTGA